MDIAVHVVAEKPGVSVVRMSGRLDTATYEASQPVMLEALEKAAAGIIMDLEFLEFISSAGLRVMLILGKQAHGNGKRIALINVQPPIYKIFKIAGLDKVFHFFEDESEALRQLSP